MKSVLISIQPKWCELIASGKKTVEVRKTAPKLEPPFKGYIYATKPKRFIKGYADDDLFRHVDGRIECGFSFQLATEKGATVEKNILSGKVIGEFVCDKVECIKENHIYNAAILCKKSCLSIHEIAEYTKGKTFYAWHISQLKIYDTPKELGEFIRCQCKHKERNPRLICDCYCEYGDNRCFEKGGAYKSLTRPPQSWCYVQEIEL